jgi:hypothetical protein
LKHTDAARFYHALKSLELFFRDTLTEEHELMYWDTMREQCTIDEWEYACAQIRPRHDFNAVPLPAKLMPYIEEYRVSRRQHDKEREQAQRRTLEAAERLVLEADPVWQEAERRRKEDLRRMEEEAYKVLARNLGPNWRDTDTHHQIPRHLPGEDLHYTPSDDPARLRAQALAKIEQLKAQLAREQEEQDL